MTCSNVPSDVSDDADEPPEEPPSFHDAFQEDRARAYREFAATGFLLVGAMLVIAGVLRPRAPGSPMGLALGVLLAGIGVVMMYLELVGVLGEEAEIAGDERGPG